MDTTKTNSGRMNSHLVSVFKILYFGLKIWMVVCVQFCICILLKITDGCVGTTVKFPILLWKNKWQFEYNYKISHFPARK